MLCSSLSVSCSAPVTTIIISSLSLLLSFSKCVNLHPCSSSAQFTVLLERRGEIFSLLTVELWPSTGVRAGQEGRWPLIDSQSSNIKPNIMLFYRQSRQLRTDGGGVCWSFHAAVTFFLPGKSYRILCSSSSPDN